MVKEQFPRSFSAIKITHVRRSNRWLDKLKPALNLLSDKICSSDLVLATITRKMSLTDCLAQAIGKILDKLHKLKDCHYSLLVFFLSG